MNAKEIVKYLEKNTDYYNYSFSNNKITLTAKGSENEWDLELVIPNSFPNKLPTVYLKNPASYGLLEHVCWQGIVCYNDGEGISIDYRYPMLIVREVLAQCVIILNKAVFAGNSGLLNEFEGYWNKVSDNIRAICYIPEDDISCRIRASVSKKKTRVSFFSNNHGLSDKYGFLPTKGGGANQTHAFHLNLSEATPPPLAGEPVNKEFVRKCLSLANEGDIFQIYTFLDRKSRPQDLYFLITQPRPKGGVSKFGLLIRNGRKWFLNQNSPIKPKFIPMCVERHTEDYLKPRGGASYGLQNKKVAIIGCGAVGSRIAEYLIMGGVKHLHLQDYDIYSSDNIFRHILDSKWVGYHKVDALQAQLLTRFPYINVTTDKSAVFEISHKLMEFDSVCLALGDPTIERKISSDHYKLISEIKPELITTWLEAFGIGGHVIMQDGYSRGCLNCLYHRDNSFLLSPLNNFIEAGQKITRNLTGCGGAFVPYAALDAGRTAELTARKILSLISDNDPTKYKYQFWIADEVPKEAIGINLTPAYYCARKNALLGDVNAMLAKGCPVCRK